MTALIVRAQTLVLPEATMTFGGLHYTRIWLQRAPEAGREGGGLEVDVPAIQRLAASATSIHIRLSGQPHRSVTLRQGVLWPLERLRRGLPFDVTDSGGDVRPAPCILHPALRTPHPAPATRNPQPARCAEDHAPCAMHPAPNLCAGDPRAGRGHVEWRAREGDGLARPRRRTGPHAVGGRAVRRAA